MESSSDGKESFRTGSPQVRIQLPLVDSCTQTDLIGGVNPQLTSILLHPYSYKEIPVTAYYPSVSEDSIHPPHYSTIFDDKMAPTTNGSIKTNSASSNKVTSASSNHVETDNDLGGSAMDFSISVDRKRKRQPRTGLSAYLVALRPWSFPGSITPVGLGSCLAYKFQGQFDPYIFLATVFTALCVHAAGNLVNTYFDFVRGVDNKKSDDRTLVDSLLTPNDVATLGAALYITGCAGFVLLTLISPARMEHLALIYFCGLSSSFLYTGGLGLKYIAMGDVLIVLTFGPITVVFSHLSQTGSLSLVPLVYAIPLALTAEAILHANNARDAESDRQAGAVTLAIILGKGGSYCLFCFLIFTPMLLFITIGIHYCKWMLIPVAAIFSAFALEKEFRRGQLAHMPQRVARLNLFVGLLYIIALCMADPASLPSMTPLSS